MRFNTTGIMLSDVWSTDKLKSTKNIHEELSQMIEQTKLVGDAIR